MYRGKPLFLVKLWAENLAKKTKVSPRVGEEIWRCLSKLRILKILGMWICKQIIWGCSIIVKSFHWHPCGSHSSFPLAFGPNTPFAAAYSTSAICYADESENWQTSLHLHCFADLRFQFYNNLIHRKLRCNRMRISHPIPPRPDKS